MLIVRVTPNAKSEGTAGIWRGADGTPALQLRVRSKPQDGAANAAVVALLSKTLNVPKSQISIISGSKDRLKSVLIKGDPLALEETVRRTVDRLSSSQP